MAVEVTREQGSQAGQEAGRPVVAGPSQHQSRARDLVAATVQHGLLAGFAAVAAGISAQGLIGFARDNMALAGPWPYLLFFALDGAAGVCAVLLLRRAARAKTALAPRLAVWGLVAASAAFNWAHAPHHPAARQAFALMPVIAATLFEFSLRETARQTRRAVGRADRRPTGLGWLRPIETLRVQIHLAAARDLLAEDAIRRVRIERAARLLHQLRQILHTDGQAAGSGSARTWRARRVERRASAALSRAGFADPGTAAEILRQAQVLTWTPTLARLDYTTPAAARAAIGNLITPIPTLASPPAQGTSVIPNGSHDLTHPGQRLVNDGAARWPGLNEHVDGAPGGGNHAVSNFRALGDALDGNSGLPTSYRQRSVRRRRSSDAELVEAATRVVAESRDRGVRLSQAALAQRVRAQGHGIANHRLPWLASASGLEPGQEPT